MCLLPFAINYSNFNSPDFTIEIEAFQAQLVQFITQCFPLMCVIAGQAFFPSVFLRLWFGSSYESVWDGQNTRISPFYVFKHYT